MKFVLTQKQVIEKEKRNLTLIQVDMIGRDTYIKTARPALPSSVPSGKEAVVLRVR